MLANWLNTKLIQVSGSTPIQSRSRVNLEDYFVHFLIQQFVRQGKVFQLLSLIFEATHSNFVMLSLPPRR